MRPIKFKGENGERTAPEGMPEVQTLPIYTNGHFCLSRWKVSSFREWLKIVLTGRIWVNHLGWTLPPLTIGVRDPRRDTAVCPAEKLHPRFMRVSGKGSDVYECECGAIFIWQHGKPYNVLVNPLQSDHDKAKAEHERELNSPKKGGINSRPIKQRPPPPPAQRAAGKVAGIILTALLLCGCIHWPGIDNTKERHAPAATPSPLIDWSSVHDTTPGYVNTNLLAKIQARDGGYYLGVYLGMIAETEPSYTNWNGKVMPPSVMMFSATSGQLLKWITCDDFTNIFILKTQKEYP